MYIHEAIQATCATAPYITRLSWHGAVRKEKLMQPDGKFLWEKLIELLERQEGVKIEYRLIPTKPVPDSEPAA